MREVRKLYSESLCKQPTHLAVCGAVYKLQNSQLFDIPVLMICQNVCQKNAAATTKVMRHESAQPESNQTTCVLRHIK